MRWSAHQISNTVDKSTFPKKSTWRDHTTDRRGRREEEPVNGTEQSNHQSFPPWLPMQSKNTHLKNLNKLDLQCPQRKWEADEAELQKLAMQEREANYDQEVRASGMFTRPSYRHSNGGRKLKHRRIQILVTLLSYIETFIGLQSSSTRGFKENQTKTNRPTCEYVAFEKEYTECDFLGGRGLTWEKSSLQYLWGVRTRSGAWQQLVYDAGLRYAWLEISGWALGQRTLDVVLWCHWSRKPVLASQTVREVPEFVSRNSWLFSSFQHNEQKADVRGKSLIIQTGKCSRSLTESTKNKQSNPESNVVFFPPDGSTLENKQGLDASVSKSLFTLRWWRALKRAFLCSVKGLGAKDKQASGGTGLL